jgi:UDP:flavonoid glycosyltransferase YjiC (YdhE family)
VPYAAVVNAYWSPYADVTYPIPDLPVTRVLGVKLAQRLFDIVRPLAFASHAQPLNRVRRQYGLPPLGHDLRHSYTWGDYTLYADIPEVIPTSNLPGNHRYLGPVLWSTQTPLPAWWDTLPTDKPVICFTLGSSGKADLLPSALQALAQLPVTIIAATAGKATLPELPPNVYHADYLPLDAALQRARLLVCNGGSLSTYQALACGVPVIGVCSNLDQLLNMTAMERLGCGVLLRAGGLAAVTLRDAARTVLDTPSYSHAAKRMAQTVNRYDAGQRFRDTVAEMLGFQAARR